MSPATAGESLALIVTVGTRTCAIPARYVEETMRPLAIEPMSGTPAFVPGVSVIRGVPTPVVDLRSLLENADNPAPCGRWVTIKDGERRLALAVDSVVGLRELDQTELRELPSLLRAVDADFVEAIGTCDARLLVVLRASRIVPEDLWATLAAGTEAR